MSVKKQDKMKVIDKWWLDNKVTWTFNDSSRSVDDVLFDLYERVEKRVKKQTIEEVEKALTTNYKRLYDFEIKNILKKLLEEEI